MRTNNFSLYWEIGNAFSAMLKRNRISLEMAKTALEHYSKIPLRLVEVNLESSLIIANQFNIYAYDAYFLECSKRFNSALVTLDKNLLNIAKEINLKIIEI